MTNCPFCSDVLLRHVRAGQIYWLCRRCYTEISAKNPHQIAHSTSGEVASNDGKPAVARQSQLPVQQLTAKLEVAAQRLH